MKIEKVFYSKTFEMPTIGWEKVGLEIQVEEGEAPTNILDAAKSIVESWHIETNKDFSRKQLPFEKVKQEPDIIILKKYDNAVKAKDEKTVKEIEENYNII